MHWQESLQQHYLEWPFLEQVLTLSLRLSRKIGALIGAQTGAILGGFAAIKLNGSEEVLINSQAPLNSYAIKALQSNYINGILAHFWLFNPIVQVLQEQALGSVAYHSLTVIKPMMKSINEGHLLDDFLVKPSSLTPEEKKLIEEGIKNAYTNPTIYKVYWLLLLRMALKRMSSLLFSIKTCIPFSTLFKIRISPLTRSN